MTKLLFVTSSLFGEGSQSRLIAGEFVDRWRRAHPGTVVVRARPDGRDHAASQPARARGRRDPRRDAAAPASSRPPLWPMP